MVLPGFLQPGAKLPEEGARILIHICLRLVTIGNELDFFPWWGAIATLAALWCHPGSQNNVNEKFKKSAATIWDLDGALGC